MNKESKSEQAYRLVRERILNGKYVPGYRLALAPIASELGMSPVPVREAIRRLEAENLVTFERNIGAQVSLLHEDEYLSSMQAIAIVEGAATAFAAPHVSTQQLERAREINTTMHESIDTFDPSSFTELNLQFHEVLFESCPNPVILEYVHQGWDRIKMLRNSSFSFVPSRALLTVREHEEIIHLIERKADPLEIEAAARAHRIRTLDAVIAQQSQRVKN